MTTARVALVVKRSTWRLFVEERKDPLYRKLVARNDPTVASLRRSHEEHERVVDARAAPRYGGKSGVVPRPYTVRQDA